MDLVVSQDGVVGPTDLVVSGIKEDDDRRLCKALERSGRAETSWFVAQEAEVDPGYAEIALSRMADSDTAPVLRRRDLGNDVYEVADLG